MELRLETGEQRAGSVTVSVAGRLNADNVSQLEEHVMGLITPETRILVLDLKDLVYISSAGIRVIVKARKALDSQHGQFMMINIQPQIRKVFEIIESLPGVSIFKDVQELDDYLDVMQRREMEKD